MIKRKFINRLLEWKNTHKENCLLVTGSRQIGKTFTIREFGKKHYKSFIELNFIENPQAKTVFDSSLFSKEILKNISLNFPEFKHIEKDTLIFLDEIQECPNARTALKFLAQDATIDVISSGSLLGIHYKDVVSIPVGYEKQVEMYALDFEEFLWALGYDENVKDSLFEYFEKKEQVPKSINEKFLELLREYMVVGGMPAVVNEYITSRNFGSVHEIQMQILKSYYDDISKYASNTEKPKIKNCYLSIPKQLSKENKKFQFSVLEKKSTARKYENSVEWLRDAGFVRLCKNVSAPNFPLSAYEKDDVYKMYMNDTGLLIALYGFEMKAAIIQNTLKGDVKGGIYENLVSDMLYKNGHNLNYWRTDDGAREIEFLVHNESSVIPIEVKSKNGSTVSLNGFLENDDVPFGYKLISGNLGVQEKKITLPIYMAMFL